MSIITLTTDFGLTDWFVGTMKGVILCVEPSAQIVDITHDIRAGDIQAGAFALAAACRFFPKHTVHVAVIDPGVGSERKAIAVRTSDYFFVGPDNGVLSLALAHENIKAVHRITNDRLFRRPVSNTFHGRDVFAPVAAHLSKGLHIRSLGPAAKNFVQLSRPGLRRRAESISGEIVYIDRFGNAITDIRAEALDLRTVSLCEVFVKGRSLGKVQPFYEAAPRGKPAVVRGSSGFLEIAVNGYSAEKRLHLKIGDEVTVRLKSPQKTSSS
jgi:S-adenosylmethionine hydrolase